MSKAKLQRLSRGYDVPNSSSHNLNIMMIETANLLVDVMLHIYEPA